MTNFNNLLLSILRFETDHEFALARAMDELATRFRAQTATLHRFDNSRRRLVMSASVGLPPHIAEITKEIPLGKGIAGEAAESRKPVTMCNLQTDDSGVAKPAAKQTGVGGALCVPIELDGELVGTLGVGTTREYEYTAEETNALLAAGRVFGGYLMAGAR